MKKIIKKLIPISKKEKLKYKKEVLELKILNFVIKSNFLISIYYMLNKEFNREHRSVLSGKIKHLSDLKNTKSSHYMLRRNIHRLEKGLLMKPRRKVFAVNYIEETVECYFSLIKSQNAFLDTGELKWAHDVLSEYFKVVSSHKVIDKIRTYFFESQHKLLIDKTSETNYVPYLRNLTNRPGISYADLLELAQFRRSVRWFKQIKVPRELIDKAIKLANFSPSACNRQPFRFRVFDDQELLKRITEMPMGTKGYNYNIPTMIALVGDLSAYPFEKDRHLIYIDSSLAAMSFVFALETLHVSSCIINWPDIEKYEKDISTFLDLNSFERVIMLIGIGYPDETGKVAYSKKKDLQNIRQYNI